MVADARQHLQVEVGQRDHRVDLVLGTQLQQDRHVGLVGHPGHQPAVIGRVEGRRQAAAVSGDHRSVLTKGRDYVVALADAGDQHRQGPAPSPEGSRQPPVSPL